MVKMCMEFIFSGSNDKHALLSTDDICLSLVQSRADDDKESASLEHPSEEGQRFRFVICQIYH